MLTNFTWAALEPETVRLFLKWCRQLFCRSPEVTAEKQELPLISVIIWEAVLLPSQRSASFWLGAQQPAFSRWENLRKTKMISMPHPGLLWCYHQSISFKKTQNKRKSKWHPHTAILVWQLPFAFRQPKTIFTRWKMEKSSSQLARTEIPYRRHVFLSGLWDFVVFCS